MLLLLFSTTVLPAEVFGLVDVPHAGVISDHSDQTGLDFLDHHLRPNDRVPCRNWNSADCPLDFPLLVFLAPILLVCSLFQVLVSMEYLGYLGLELGEEYSSQEGV